MIVISKQGVGFACRLNNMIRLPWLEIKKQPKLGATKKSKDGGNKPALGAKQQGKDEGKKPSVSQKLKRSAIEHKLRQEATRTPEVPLWGEFVGDIPMLGRKLRVAQLACGTDCGDAEWSMGVAMEACNVYDIEEGYKDVMEVMFNKKHGSCPAALWHDPPGSGSAAPSHGRKT